MTPSNYHSQSGMALVTALLYLGVLTLLVTAALSSSIVQSKISQQIHQEAQSFSYAELALKKGEDATLTLEEKGEGSSLNTKYQFTRISTPSSECGLFYEIDTTAQLEGSSTILTSIFNIPQAGENPCIDPTLKPHRVAWEEHI